MSCGGFNYRIRCLHGGIETRTRKPRRATKEREPPRQIGIIAISKGPYLEPISVVIILSYQRRKRADWADWDRTFKAGTWATSRHVS